MTAKAADPTKGRSWWWAAAAAEEEEEKKSKEENKTKGEEEGKEKERRRWGVEDEDGENNNLAELGMSYTRVLGARVWGPGPKEGRTLGQVTVS